MKSLIVIVFLFFLEVSYSKSPLEKLLVISYDGFRYDYLQTHKNITPTLNSLKSSSSYAKCLLNVFPTQTFPNHFTLATGVYSGIHGVLGSHVYDKETLGLLSYDSLFHYNNDILPIWALNEKAGDGRHSGVMMWPGSNLQYSDITSTFVYNYSSKVPYDIRVSTVMSWFKDPKTPANFVMMYFEEPDADSHAFGPDSAQNLKQIQRVDNTTKYILSSLKNNNLTDVNIVFLSDHGMEGVTKDHIIDLNAVVGKKADMYGTSPVMQIYPKPGENVASIFATLNKTAFENGHFKVYLQADIPQHFQIRDCKRTPPILAVAEPPYAFQDLYASIEWFVKHKNASDNGIYGVHGYDPNYVKMHPYFIAHGPRFRKNFDAGELRSIDMFPLFTHILNLEEPPVKPNGSFTGVEKLFMSSAAQNIVLPAYIIGGFVVCMLAIFLATTFCLNKSRTTNRGANDSIIDTEEEKLLEATCSV